MEGFKTIDIFDLGKDSLNYYYNNLRNAKKALKNYLTIVDTFTKIVSDNKIGINIIFKDIKQFSEIDMPYPILKNLEILIHLYDNYNEAFYESISTPIDNLKKTIINSYKYVSNYLNFSQIVSMNIRNMSNKYYQSYNKLMGNLGDTEMAIIDEYTKSKYKISINKLKNKGKEKDKIIKECVSSEKEFLSVKSKIKDQFDNYINQYNSIMKKINPKVVQINEEIKDISLICLNTLKSNNENFLTMLKNESEKIIDIDNNFEKEANVYFNHVISKEDNDEMMQHIELKKYNIKILKEEEKTLIECDTLKQKSKKATKALIYTNQDIYNIVKTIYDYNFSMVNKEAFNLEKEQVKIKIHELMGKVLNYNFETRVFGKEKSITQEELDYLFNILFQDDDYFMKFLLCLNNYRTTGKYELAPDIYNLINILFSKKADELLVKNNLTISGLIVILSQTFYMLKDNEKYYLQKEVQKKELFRDLKFWREFFDNGITEEMIKFEEESKRMGITYTKEKKEKKLEEIVFSKIASLVTSLTDFELGKEKIFDILLPLFDKYKISDEKKESIIQLI